ncbi:YetF domain-containing protein [Paraflavisolibacter sp. H34]|uniref:DUF421 domain-containing protein n=1 Tax=Huijunlia imazamoxiresistens TaxID=3127457 RepID=UPI0030164F0B
MPKDIQLWDFKRILLGEAPPEFLLEVFIRALIVYLLALAVTRLLGKRMNGQLTIFEFAIILTMGAIVSPPMQLPDRGIVPGVLVLLLTLLLLRGVTWLAFKSGKFEKVTNGDYSLLVKDGVLQMNQLNEAKVSRNQLFAALRTKNIFHLGKVKRVYLEACGIFSVYSEPLPKPGLPLFPMEDPHALHDQEEAPDPIRVCGNCGQLHLQGTGGTCSNCGNTHWIKAIQ